MDRRTTLVALVVLTSCRIGFDEIEPESLTEVFSSFSATANSGGEVGEIILAFELAEGLEVRNIERIDFYRVSGFEPPATCADGVLAVTLTDLGPRSVVDTIDGLWERVHSYRACATTTSGDEFTSAAMTTLPSGYHNPGPGCHAPPCSAPGSSVITTGGFTRSAAILSATASTSGDAILADLDEDGALDVIVAASPGLNVIHRGNGDGLFGAGVPTSNRGLGSVAAVVADFNNDGRKDVVFANNDGPSYLHLGADTGLDTGSPIYGDTYTEMFDVEAVDLNGDDATDLVFARFGAEDLIYLGDGDGGFRFLRQVRSTADNSCVNCLAVADVNNDLKPDVIIGYNTGDQRLNVFRGVGDADATLDPPFSVSYGSLTPIAVKLADINSDGLLDMVVGRSQGGGLFVTLGDGAGAFTPLTAIDTTTSSRNYGIGLADFTGDGNADIAFSQDDAGVVGFLVGDGQGNFGRQVDLDGGSQWTTTNIDVGDVNNDGKIDFIIGEALTGSQVFLGD